MRKRKREELKGVEIRPLTPAEERLEQEDAAATAAAVMGFFFWLLIGIAMAALVVHYVFPAGI